MRKLSFLEKLFMPLLTLIFIVSFNLTTIISMKPVEEDARFFFIGVLMAIINVGAFFGTLKILRKHYNYRNHKGIRIYYYTIIILPLILALEYLMFYQQWLYIPLFFALAAIDIYIVNQEFGRLSIKIAGDHDQLLVGDLTSSNSYIKVRAKNKKFKSSSEEIETGDVIIIERESQTILTLNVIKNK